MPWRRCAAMYPARISNNQKTLGQWLPAKQCRHRVKDPTKIYCGAHSNGAANSTERVKDPAHLAKLNAGRDRWRAQINRLKAEGVIEVAHSSEFKKGNKAATKKNKMIAAAKRAEYAGSIIPQKQVLKASRLLEAEQKTLPAVPDKPFEELEDHEKLTSLTGKSLNIINQIISMPIDPDQPVLFKEQMKLLSGTLSLRVKVDRNMLAARKQDKMAEIVERLKRGGSGGEGSGGAPLLDVTPRKGPSPSS